MAYNFTAIEKKWQQHWLDNKSFRALDPADAGSMPKAYILDMFPYPSGSGLHVGHPEGYTATDIISRYMRMKGFNVLHPMGWDAFGLPAEQYAIKTNTHPRVTTENNIANFRKQIQMLGLSYDWEREVDTTDPKYHRWTQWIFLQLFNSYFDPIEQKAKSIEHLKQELLNENLVVAPDGEVVVNPTQEGMEPIAGEVRVERLWRELSEGEQKDVIDTQRLAYMDEIPVNWCPGLGTVLSNEEVIDGKSEVGGFPVERRPMRQWMLRITAYADRLLKDLDLLQWPDSLKEMQRNWIGRSTGAEVDFEIASDEATKARSDEGQSPSSPSPGTPEEGRGEGSSTNPEDDLSITVFTTRPDTLYGATYMVLAPEHPLVDRLTPSERRESIEAYRTMIAGKSDRERMADAKEKTGAFIGAYAVNPVNGDKIPIYIADYVMMGYGTGAIMAVPAHDERDYEFAKKFNVPIKPVVLPPIGWLREAALNLIRQKAAIDPKIMEAAPNDPIQQAAIRGSTVARVKAVIERDEPEIVKKLQEDYAGGIIGQCFTGEGTAINSPTIDGLPTAEAKEKITKVLSDEGVAYGSVKYKLRDWLFSRQRYWGEPFPILLDADGRAHAIDESELPLELPQMEDFKPTGTPEPPLSKAKEWLNVTRDGKTFTRETNTMPQWAGSCWYYLRYIDPLNSERFIDPEKEKYWMPVDLYVGGVEHAVLHLLYARFWHKVLFDLGHVTTPEPFARLVNQGLILGEMEYHVFQTSNNQPISAADVRDVDEEATPNGVTLIAYNKQTGEKVAGKRVDETEVEKAGDGHVLKSNTAIRIDARSFKMSKSRGNVVNPDDIVKDYGADTFRLYEMYMGPLEAQKPWNTRDIVGMARFLSSAWRNLIGDDESNSIANRKLQIANSPIPEALDRQMHRAIKKVADDIEHLRFNTAIAELIKLNNELTGMDAIPRELAENFVLMLAPFAPHIAEEIWERLGHHRSLTRRPWPTFDEAKLVDSTLELPVQVNGKLRDKITVPADADEATILKTAESAEKIKPWMEGKTVKKRLYVPKKLVNFVVG